MYYFFGGVAWFALCILTATLADKKGHNGIGFFFFSSFSFATYWITGNRLRR